ncbi:hypothetical protein UFOVP967_71 [uncultured Caudovirales phage]|uniref:Uncharacterized protein n=1 Tax=uncultured Caudovirales phage TaxID=2100421 RepID=A0A6J5MRB8_9CAUD|nr:hypothetical protein UFOVP521_45 [uncultured Caudovirales phage]CAB4167258.1 hypothetical protein UFOVP856_17 [uncultured Caudovirales phage]CAB4174663.1 hypothetical protein UFOVP967_71 [uncultured Caudovirales phage]CAB4180200.1 hypothetical protein UFOVP1036_10 [uncultured Caudovirales phage]CAB4186268.1 hypothetical protein UFOVP1132_57 [uncultured Caudovirales phage]
MESGDFERLSKAVKVKTTVLNNIEGRIQALQDQLATLTEEIFTKYEVSSVEELAELRKAKQEEYDRLKVEAKTLLGGLNDI